ncbi:MAG: hypothetical protein Q4E00_11375, partial [Actinomyces bowdenii]|nr:hypothetical protein [Actinomyces bowdenii]
MPAALGVLLVAPASGNAATGVETAPEAAAIAQGLPDPGGPDPEQPGAGQGAGVGAPEEACTPAVVVNLPGGEPAGGAVPAYTVGQALSIAATGWCETPGTALPDPEITVNLHGPDELKRYETGIVLYLADSGEEAGSAIGDLPFDQLLEEARAFNHDADIPGTGTFSLTLTSDEDVVTTGVFTVSEAAPEPSPTPTPEPEPAPSPSPEPSPDPAPEPSASSSPEPTAQPSASLQPSPEPSA